MWKMAPFRFVPARRATWALWLPPISAPTSPKRSSPRPAKRKLTAKYQTYGARLGKSRALFLPCRPCRGRGWGRRPNRPPGSFSGRCPLVPAAPERPAARPSRQTSPPCRGSLHVWSFGQFSPNRHIPFTKPTRNPLIGVLYWHHWQLRPGAPPHDWTKSFYFDIILIREILQERRTPHVGRK